MSFIAGLEQIAVQLRDLGVTVTDVAIITKVLVSLPSSFENFGPAWDSTPADQKTLSALTQRLVKLEKQINKKKEEDKTDPVSALYAGYPPPPPPPDGSALKQYAFPARDLGPLGGPWNRGRGGRGGYRARGGFGNRGSHHPYAGAGRRGGLHQPSYQSNGGNPAGHQQLQVICHYCGGQGHIRRHCRNLKRDRSYQQNYEPYGGGDQNQSFSYKSSICFAARRYSFLLIITLNFEGNQSVHFSIHS